MNWLQCEPIDVEQFRQSLFDTSCGAVVTFEGRVRDHSSAGKKTRALFYEAFPGLTLKVFEEIRREAHARWKVGDVDIAHRVGSLQVGETATVIQVSSPHRREAFEACAYVLEELKKRAPIWKKEIYEDGTEQWVGHGDRHAAGGGAK